jgi:MFS family permease
MEVLSRIYGRFWRPALNPQEHNIRILYVELIGAGVMTGAASFNAAFAVRLGASEELIGLLNSVPPLIAALVSIPAARFMEGHTDRRPYILWSLLLVRLGYLGVAILPSLATQHTATWLVIWLIALNLPSTIFVVGWQPMLADILPERRRAFVFSRRNIIAALVTAVATFFAGIWLRSTIFPSNYQVMYAVGVIGAMHSCMMVEGLIIPSSEVVNRRRDRTRHFAISAASLKVVRERVLSNRAFISMTFNTMVFDFGLWMSVPLFTLYFVRELNADDGWLGVHSTLASLATVGGYYMWERVVRRRGFYWTLVRTMPFSFLYPFCVALFPSLVLILVFDVMIGFINSGMNLSHFNVLLKVCPRERRASYLGFYNTVANMVAFLAPLVAVALSRQIGIRRTLLVAAGLRLIGGLLFQVFRFQEPPEAGDDEPSPPPAVDRLLPDETEAGEV